MSEIKVGDFRRIKITNTFVTVEVEKINKINSCAKVKGLIESEDFAQEKWVSLDDLYELEPFEEDVNKMLHYLLKTLRECSCAGNPINNDLVKLVYFKADDKCGIEQEYIRPIFRNGVGNNGYYDVRVTGYNNIGMLIEVVKKFVDKMW